MRDKLIELITHAKEMRETDAMDIVRESECDIFDKLAELRSEAEYISDHLLANGVTVATDNNDGCKGCLYANRKRPQKCSCCSRNIDMKDCYTPDYDRHWTERPPKGE